MKYYLSALYKYADFHGRAVKSECWGFIALNICFAMAAAILDNMLETRIRINAEWGHRLLPFGYLFLIYLMSVMIPGFAILSRRLHDVGKSGWYCLLLLIPIIGWIWMSILLLTDSNEEVNKYGIPENIINNSLQKMEYFIVE